MKLSISELTTYRWTFEEDVEHYVSRGIPAIGVWRPKLSDCGEEEGIDLLCSAGLSVSSLLWAGGFTGSDLCSHREAIDDGIDALRAAAALGADCLIVYSGPRAGHTRRHARRLVMTALDELSAAATDLDVTLALEPVHEGCARDWTFLTSLDKTLRLLDDVRGGDVKIVFDTYHLAQGGFDSERLASLVPRIALVQLADACGPPRGEQDRCRLGEGRIPLADLLRVLDESGYDGYCEVELIGERFERCDYGELLGETVETFDRLSAGINSRQINRSLPRA